MKKYSLPILLFLFKISISTMDNDSAGWLECKGEEFRRLCEIKELQINKENPNSDTKEMSRMTNDNEKENRNPNVEFFLNQSRAKDACLIKNAKLLPMHELNETQTERKFKLKEEDGTENN